MGNLDAAVAGRLLAATGDVSLVVDGEGVIRDVAIGNPDLADAGVGDWIGRPWADIVTRDSRSKINQMLRDAAEGTAPRWRQINHLVGEGEVPIRYLAMAGGRAGGVVAIGRDLRATAALQQRLIQAQQSMERDYLKLRQIESRYRLLFGMTSEPMLIVDSRTRKIAEANPAAEDAIGKGKLVGQAFSAIVAQQDREPALALLGAVAASDRVPPVSLRLAADDCECEVAATFFRQGRHSYYLVRLTRADAAPREASQNPAAAALNRIPDPFVLTDENMVIAAHNDAFLELTQMPRSQDVDGEPLGRFVGRPGIDPNLIAAQLREHGSLRNFSTIVRTRYDQQEEVELSAVAAREGDRTCYGFTIRPVTREREPVLTEAGAPRSVEHLTELVGRMALKDIVRESTDLIERLCIEAALEYTSDNRASAAELLGLSRQSLYSKLHRHGLASGSSEPEE